MTAERWQRVQALCDTVDTAASSASLSSIDPRVLLEQLEPDESLRDDALALLQAMRDDEAYQREHAGRHHGDGGEPGAIGGIRILERLGAGGSGDVFRGVRTINGTEQIVAVKRFHAHAASPEHRERFAREQRMLAVLTHPDIVRFLDAGVTGDGQPYLVMELADGQPITSYCDAQRLALADRLRLFASVCDAVQSAHRHLIVHLDLKPSNILVTDDGHVKLLDFGTAKLVDPMAALTRTEPLTLLYGSPERLRGEAVSVACDVYSLGLILYELLAGAWPFRGRESIMSVAERAAGHTDIVPLSRAIADDAAARLGADRRRTTPDRWRAAVAGDLEAIVAKTLAHEPASRYASVADLADDLRRYLAGDLVRARAPGLGYRVSKFVRRHAYAVAAVIAVITGLMGAAVYSAAQARVARAAADRATTQNEFLTSLFTLAGSDAASRHDMTVRELLSLAEQRISPTLGANAAVASDVEMTLARGYVSQNAYAEARTLLQRAINRAAELRDVAREAEARAYLSYVAYVQNQNGEATANAQAALSLWKRKPSRFTPAQAVVTLRHAAGTLLFVRTTDPVHREYLEACRDLANAYPRDIGSADRASCLYGLATSYANLESRYDEADALLRQALDLQRADGETVAMASTLQMLGLVNRYQGRFAEDERAQREAYDIIARLQGAESTAALWQRAVWVASLTGVSRLDEAYKESRLVLAAARKVYPARGSYLLWTPLFSASSAACMTARYAECEALAAEALDTLGPNPATNDPRFHTARGFLGVALAHRGKYAEARPLIDDALAMQARRKRIPPYADLLRSARLIASAPDASAAPPPRGVGGEPGSHQDE